MQPRPIADTFKPSLPSVRVLNVMSAILQKNVRQPFQSGRHTRFECKRHECQTSYARHGYRLREDMSITKRYFTSPFSNRS
jgi:hypothetical protein